MLYRWRSPQPHAVDLAEAARECLTFSMYRLAHIAGESDVTLLLTDAAGTLIHVLDAGVKRCPAGAHLAQLGVSWRESNLGNTGIGTALKLCEPIAFEGKEHFFEGLHPFATAGCPILGWDGRLIGGLGAMTDHHDSAKALLGLLRLATCLLEQDLLERCAPGDVLLRLRPDKLDDDLGLEEGLVDGLMSVRSDGTIEGLNRIAVLLLACEDSLAIIGRPLKTVLGLELADLHTKLVSEGAGARLRLANGRWLIVDPVLRRTGSSQRIGGAGVRVVERYQIQAAKMPPGGYDEKPEGVRDIILAPLLRKAVGLQAQKISILITGESGTGKEHFVRQLRELGPRRNKPFVAVNCGAMPRELIESELFGYAGGSFTGALDERKGRKVPGGGRRHPAAGRNRRNGAGSPGCLAARAGIVRGNACRQHAGNSPGCPCGRRNEPALGGQHPERQLSSRPLLSAERRANNAAAVAGASGQGAADRASSRH